MKTCNMPNRVNMRRKRALERLLAQPMSEATKEIKQVLESRIMPENEALGIRTKKDRRDKAKIGRY